eukprot:CAMPEP_0119327474 /NCGR_PEP_ID=MMETSP1333-20130426/70862_1 /TAXON_ID=418940 /ORGANISM="Scyphosphaera apsteinii, Strain RCC1455" /LENGTH=72 /DNA_ID=CAMNT_0007336079 /DNA_START=204 /DNA_END=422 /DNA_ORIENTATION=+
MDEVEGPVYRCIGMPSLADAQLVDIDAMDGPVYRSIGAASEEPATARLESETTMFAPALPPLVQRQRAFAEI